MSTPWSRSILPKDRDHRINGLFDFACGAWRLLGSTGQVTRMTASVIDGDGHAYLIIRDARGLRRITITDERVDAAEVGLMGGEEVA